MDKRGVAFRQIVMVFYLIMAIIVIVTLIQRAKIVAGGEEKADAYSKIIERPKTLNYWYYFYCL